MWVLNVLVASVEDDPMQSIMDTPDEGLPFDDSVSSRPELEAFFNGVEDSDEEDFRDYDDVPPWQVGLDAMDRLAEEFETEYVSIGAPYTCIFIVHTYLNFGSF
jgi:hypothetical protein